MKRALAALALLVAAVAAAWLLSARREVRRDPGLSVLLVTIDTLRADALGSYGRDGAGTPWMDRLAAAGVRFEDAHAHNVVTLPSHANILSGRYPFDHGVRDNAGFRFPSGTETLATLLKARGYRTGAFVSAFPVDSRFGLTRGFDVYDDRFGDAGTHTAFRMQERPGTETVAAARAWLQAQGAAPTFSWVHLYEPHFPYQPPEPLASRFRDQPYQGEVAATDAALGPLLEPLLAAGARGRTLVVLTSDHGEGLGEHGEMTHGIFAYEGTLRVPLLLFQPGILAPAVVEAPARHVDLLPTVLDGLGRAAPADLPGRSLLPLAAATNLADAPSYFEALAPSLNRGWAPLHGTLRDRTKYIDLPIPELYALTADPREERNLAPSRPEELERLRLLLRGFRSADRGVQRGAESAETRERLRALGYVTSASAAPKERYTEDDDPKRLIPLDAMVEEVIGRYKSGDLPGALTVSNELVRRRPGMSLALVHQGFLRHELGDLAGAIASLRQALAPNPEQTDVAALLGGYLHEAGRSREAAALLEPYARRAEPDVDVLMAFGMSLSAASRAREARQAFETVRRLDPSNAMALVNLGTLDLMAGDLPAAQRAFELALALDPRVARAYNSLGVIAAQSGRTEDALERWRRAVELDPKDHETLFNLGTVLARLGRPAEARTFFERYVSEAPAATESRDIARVRSWLAKTPVR